MESILFLVNHPPLRGYVVVLQSLFHHCDTDSTVRERSRKVQPERIFIIEPKSLKPEKKEKLKESHVDLKIK